MKSGQRRGQPIPSSNNTTDFEGRRRRPEERIGQELNGKWTLVQVLGVGGTAAVYEAVHRNGRRAAVKIMAHEKAIRSMPICQIAAHEALVANSVLHPGVVEILDNDIAEDGSVYLVMELLEGETLDTRCRRSGGRLCFDEALPLFEQLLDVLATAHDRGIVHRDIKPDNVFVTSKGQIKVLDFGLATRDTEEREDAPWFGTPGFMPPEQARAEWLEVDALSDLWAVGATLFTVLTGRLVHHPNITPAALVRATAFEDVDLSPLESVVPSMMCFDVIARALARDKCDRFPTARAMLYALRAGAKKKSARPPMVPSPARARLERQLRHGPANVPNCHSTTRIFLVRGAGGGGGGGDRDGDRDGQGAQESGCRVNGSGSRECRLTCVMCPVCPANVTTLRSAPHAPQNALQRAPDRPSLSS